MQTDIPGILWDGWTITDVFNQHLYVVYKTALPEFVDALQVIMAPQLRSGVKPKVCKMTQG